MVIAILAPPLVAWGLFCAGVMIRGGLQAAETTSAEEALLRSFPFVMMVAAIMLIVTGRTLSVSRPLFLPAGLMVAALYIVIWMFNGKRSHALIGVLSTVCAFYITRLRRPSWPVLMATLCAVALVVGIAIGWRHNDDYELSVHGILSVSLGVQDRQDPRKSEHRGTGRASRVETDHETTEYGGFLLMMDTVPEKSDYDYGTNYLRVCFYLYPANRLADQARLRPGPVGECLDRRLGTGSRRGIHWTGDRDPGGHSAQRRCCRHPPRPGLARSLLRTAYEYFRLHADVPWVQFWWAITFFNAWFMVVGDDPLIWFYYNWGFSRFPIVVLLWWTLKIVARAPEQALTRAAVVGIQQ